MRIAISQLNPHVGNIHANYSKVLEHIQISHKNAVDIIIFPELVITGYPPEDLLLRPKFMSEVRKYIDLLASVNHGIDILIGYPYLEDNNLLNRMALISSSEIKFTYDKKELPNYGVFDEKRYFTPGNDTVIVDMRSIPAGLSICEDLWEKEHALTIAAAGAKLVISINASPFYKNIQVDREAQLKTRVKESGLPIVYVNLVGGQDEVVFDGGSLVMNAKSQVVFQAPEFEEGLYYIDVRCESGEIIFEHGYGSLPNKDHRESIYQALCLGIKDYINKNGFNGAVIGLSGGIDSALTLALAVDAIGAENVEAVLMPSRYTSDMSNDDALQMAEALGVKYHSISIEKPFEAFNEILQPVFKDLPVDVTEENIQARCRGVLLMAISNKTGKIVLTTGNKSEMAVGYATLYGDMAGGFAPLKDIPKLLVYSLSEWRNLTGEVIPQRIIDRPPTAELRPEQKDEDSLPPYDILDDILERYIELDQDPQTIIAAGHDKDQVHDVVRLVDRNEYKRRQAAPGIKITKRAFGRDRRYPITSGYREN